MDTTHLLSVSPLDGRYAGQTKDLGKYFSEYALHRYRVKVEIEYLISLLNFLPDQPKLNSQQVEELQRIYKNFSVEDAQKIRETEKTTNHDVKAVEYFVKSKLDEAGLGAVREMVHFGLTSQDINNTSIPLGLKEFETEHFLPKLEEILSILATMAREWNNVPMLARTHGQPASPTRLGKEIKVFEVRIREQIKLLLPIPHAAKFGGATGNFNAHAVAYPGLDWHEFAEKFLKENLQLKRSHPTTQIEHYDHLAARLDAYKRINTIFIDFARDIWQYISLTYFKQKIKAGEIGSSAMPHKVNPIDFENAEGNFGLANALLSHLSDKLPISRLQRDLTDSTVLRNLGVPLAHTWIAFHSLLKGLGKLELNQSALNRDLEDNWAVVAEALQTILRKSGYPQPYEALKDLTRTNDAITGETISRFIDGLDVSLEVKKQLKAVSPFNYTGI